MDSIRLTRADYRRRTELLGQASRTLRDEQTEIPSTNIVVTSLSFRAGVAGVMRE